MKTRGWKVGILLVVVAFLALGVVSSVAAGEKRVLIGFTKKPGKTEETLVRGRGGKIKHTFHIVPVIAATLPEETVSRLLANRWVTHIEPDHRVWALDAELDNSWGVKHIGAGAVHGAGNKGAGVRIAIIDTGIDYTHPDLDDANYAGGWDFVNGDDDPMDDHGHGTHVAGSIAAEDDGAGVVGVAPEATLYVFKVLDKDGYGYVSDVILAIQQSTEPQYNADVINMSLGGPSSLSLETACAMAYAEGRVLVAAAGNSGNRWGWGNNIAYPAGYDSVIAVGATDQSDKRASWSSTGSQLEFMAPGVGIRSSVPGGSYATWSGTSMASPHVAGTAALVIAANSSMSNIDVRFLLQDTADDLGNAGWDSKYGYGLVDADETAPGEAPPPVPECTLDSDCDDGLYCNGAETCDAVLGCQPGTPIDCDDGIACTVDSCHEENGDGVCDHTPDDLSCDDGLYCNGAETCDAVLDCQLGTPIDCDDGNECTTDACNEGFDICDYTPVTDNLICDGGVCCSGECVGGLTECLADACGDGVCAGSSYGEDCYSCEDDCMCSGWNCRRACCGDGKCQWRERWGNRCPVDCGGG